jgi:hypothetical protein
VNLMGLLESLYKPFPPALELNPSIYWKKCERCLNPVASKEATRCLVCPSLRADPSAVLDKRFFGENWTAWTVQLQEQNQDTIIFQWKGIPIRARDIISVSVRGHRTDVELHTGQHIYLFD